ncbi:MAG: hypothetical protein PHH77_12420 [Victivallaceae bacterium]|nr:hypothetical protein [Victivallaceae bacterium]
MGKRIIISVISLVFLLLSSCSTCKPVLYPNEHYRQVGAEQAEKDVRAALDAARRAGLDNTSSSNRTLAKSASRNAASAGVNTAVGAASGGIGAGTAISTAGSGTNFLIDWMFTPKTPDPCFRKYVELTLKKQGYQVIGWK